MCNFLGKVANAAHEYGYAGEVWGALKGGRIRAMHRLFQGLGYVLNKNVAAQPATFSRNSRVPGLIPPQRAKPRPFGPRGRNSRP